MFPAASSPRPNPPLSHSLDPPPLSPPSVGAGPFSARLGTAEEALATAAAAAAAAAGARRDDAGGMAFETFLKAGDAEGIGTSGGSGAWGGGICEGDGGSGSGSGSGNGSGVGIDVGGGTETGGMEEKGGGRWPPTWAGSGDAPVRNR